MVLNIMISAIKKRISVFGGSKQHDKCHQEKDYGV
ncbi:hypothetical protein RKD52_000597 [Metabacillus sp. SLBN-84]